MQNGKVAENQLKSPEKSIKMSGLRILFAVIWGFAGTCAALLDFERHYRIPVLKVTTASTSRPTIKDVARVANVSQSTVSYILNNARAAERISNETKKRVWMAVEKLGYQFNPIGRALQRGYTNQVTLLIVSWNLATSHSATAMAISRAAAE